MGHWSGTERILCVPYNAIPDIIRSDPIRPDQSRRERISSVPIPPDHVDPGIIFIFLLNSMVALCVMGHWSGTERILCVPYNAIPDIIRSDPIRPDQSRRERISSVPIPPDHVDPGIIFIFLLNSMVALCVMGHWSGTERILCVPYNAIPDIIRSDSIRPVFFTLSNLLRNG